ncbi:hypothetical protein [Actinomadura montaniterrae]|uniref:Uncharacterized protein n=1 Tax=Actinomadura montaniterrae TaxID=1803903 RepID=A0A6L3VPE1_9ACTN|nr:hypothetical protein [Actinomadura montaniterrae]KAB2376983.1 hypothetical protein F9B16_24420 [Actinomadura montaniterrae]
MSEHQDDAAERRAELHRLVDELDAAKLPAALLRLADEHERPVASTDDALTALAALPGGLPVGEVERARRSLDASSHRRAS